MNEEPLHTEINGEDERDSSGRFKPGNKGGPGNPGIGELAKHRRHWAKSCTLEDTNLALSVLRTGMAEENKFEHRLGAAKEYLNRTQGLPVSGDVMEQFVKLEAKFRAVCEKIGIPFPE